MSNFAVTVKRSSAIEEDILSEIIFSNGGIGIEEQKDYMICSFDSSISKDTITDLFTKHNIAIYELAEIIERDWLAEWKKSYKAIELDSFLICPSWEPKELNGKISIEIDPKMAFGTGTHETTQLILNLLVQYVKPNISVLDAGTGSGILSIAAEKLGAKSIFSFDIDEVAIDNARENVEINNCKNITLKTGTLDSAGNNYDLILANINRNVLLEIADDLANRLSNNGFLILSGLLIEDFEKIKNRYERFHLIDSKKLGEWMALIFKK
jgi:ribosomal protein L11 methyltransferase